MDKKPEVLKMLSEKTQRDLNLFVVNSCISEDKEKTEKFYSLIQMVIVETITSQNKIKKNG